MMSIHLRRRICVFLVALASRMNSFRSAKHNNSQEQEAARTSYNARDPEVDRSGYCSKPRELEYLEKGLRTHLELHAGATPNFAGTVDLLGHRTEGSGSRLSQSFFGVRSRDNASEDEDEDEHSARNAGRSGGDACAVVATHVELIQVAGVLFTRANFAPRAFIARLAVCGEWIQGAQPKGVG
eukprot:5428294-Prymnesium_polylepis.5